MGKSRVQIRRVAIACLVSLAAGLFADAQSITPSVALPQPIYSPRPVYRPEWAKQGLTGNGVVLVTIDPKTGKVAGVRMLQSTGSSVLDGAALQAYSQWRFKPGSVSQVKMPISFASRPGAPPPKQAAKPLPASYYFLILLGIIVFVMAFLGRRRR
jgi:TonB family protein